MNELVNDDIKLSKLETKTSFINELPKKWLSFCQSLRNTNQVKDSELASLFAKIKHEENLIDNIYETKKNKSLVSTTPLSTAFFSTFIVQNFQDSLDDEEDTRSNHEYLNDLEEEYQTRALLAKSERFFKKGTQRFNDTKTTNQIECHKCGKKGHFTRDCWSKTSVPSYQSPFHSKLLISSENKPKSRQTKDFKAKYHKVKAKLALFSLSALTLSLSPCRIKGLIARTYDWDDEEMSSDENEVTKVKALMELTDEERVSVGKESAINDMSITSSNIPKSSETEDSTLPNHDTGEVPLNESQRNTTDPSVVVSDSSSTDYDLADESSVYGTPLLSLKKLDGITINEPSSTPARGKSSFASKTNSTPAGKLKNVKMEDDLPLAIIMKELNELKLQNNKKKSSYSRNKNAQQDYFSMKRNQS
nr:hypothetical protein [Tanacetum cinerariifolium]